MCLGEESHPSVTSRRHGFSYTEARTGQKGSSSPTPYHHGQSWIQTKDAKIPSPCTSTCSSTHRISTQGQLSQSSPIFTHPSSSLSSLDIRSWPCTVIPATQGWLSCFIKTKGEHKENFYRLTHPKASDLSSNFDYQAQTETTWHWHSLPSRHHHCSLRILSFPQSSRKAPLRSHGNPVLSHSARTESKFESLWNWIY